MSNNDTKRSTINNWLLWILFVLTFISIEFACFALSLVVDDIPSILAVEKTWVFWTFIPIPFLTMILGIINLCRKKFMWIINAVTGFIVSGILLIAGSFFLLVPTYRTEYKNISEYNEILKVELPKKGIFTRQKMDYYFDSDKTNVTIIQAFYDDYEIVKDFEKSIVNSEYWISSSEIMTELDGLLPFQMMPGDDDDCYYLFYIKELDAYNVLPSEEEIYHICVVKYDTDDYELEINDFEFEVV